MLTHQRKYFDISDWKKEQDYLQDMHKHGWKLKNVKGITYTFTSCEPEDVVYQLDYHDQANTDDSIQMFQDCGWEYIQDLNGFAYFRKPKREMHGQNEEIFCDEDSRNDMIKRVYQGRVIPLIVIFIALFLCFMNALDRPFALGILVLFTLIYIYIIFEFIIRYRKVL